MNRRTLLIHHPDGSTQVFELTQTSTTIGRAEGNHLVLHGNRVSRTHAQLAFDGDSAAILHDLKSANGVVVNGGLVQGSTTLNSGDVLLIGPYKLIYTDSNPAARINGDESGSQPFHIQAASVELDELQKQPRLMSVPDSSVELRSLELLHEVGVTLARTVTVADVIEMAVALLFKIEGVHRATLMPWDDQTQEVKAGDCAPVTGSPSTVLPSICAGC